MAVHSPGKAVTPFTPANLIERAPRALVETDVLDEEQKAGLFSDNAAALFPRFAQAPTSSAHQPGVVATGSARDVYLDRERPSCQGGRWPPNFPAAP